MKPIYRILEENGFTILDHPKNANAIVSVGDDATFLQAVRKTGFREDCLYAGFLRKMKFLSTAISILITLIQPFKKLQK